MRTLDSMTPEAAAKRAELMAARKAGQQAAAGGHAARLAEAVEWARANAWSDFYQSVAGQYDRNGDLSDKQIDAVLRGKAKQQANAAKRGASVAVDLTKLADLFARAAASGLKSPKLHFEGMTLTIAKAASKNAGAIYVKAGRDYDATYYGKIVEGELQRSRECTDAVVERLQEIAADPAGQFRLSGIRTGQCCMCGRELTNPVSIEAGIGPICAERWGV